MDYVRLDESGPENKSPYSGVHELRKWWFFWRMVTQ